MIVLLTAVMLLVAYAGKDRCVGPTFDDKGRSTPDYDIRIDRDLCYSDIQYLWLDRDIDKHVFPYVHGGITPPPDSKLTGGTVEYPVLTGLLMWVGAMFAHNDGEFLLYSALLMAPFGLATGWMLAKLARWRALAWALGPPLFLYAFHNWDLPVVACAVAAVYVVHGWRTPRSLRQRATLAGVLLGLGFAFKLYPGAFVAPLMLYVLTASRPGRRDWWGAIGVGLAATVTVVLANLPFALAGYDGLARVVHVPGAAEGRPHHQLDLVLGLPPRLRAHQRGVPALGELAVAHARDRVVRGRAWPSAGGGGGAAAATRGSRSAPRCCAASCCSTRSTRRSTRCGWCRSSCCSRCRGGGCWPTWSSTSAWTSACSAGSTR